MGKSLSQKQRAFILWKAGICTSASLQRHCKISPRTARYYIAEFNSGGTGERRDYSPRKSSKIVPQVVRKIIRKAKSRTKILSTRQIGISVGLSHTTVQAVLKFRGLSFKSYTKRLPLTKERRERRLRFARAMQKAKGRWKSTIITDEASFWLNKARPGKVWTDDPDGEVGSQVHGPKIHCWGAISARGALKLEIFEDNLNAQRYIAILDRKVPEISRMYPEGWWWQQDGSGVHRADDVADYLEENMPQKLDWPPYSPDLSPIENVWGWLKGQVAKDLPQNIDALKKSIRNHWNSVTPEFLAPYFESMPKRMAMLIENDGKKIRY